MKRLLYFAALCSIVATSLAAVAGAGPVSGSIRTQFTVTNESRTLFLVGQVDGNAAPLPNAACSFSPADGTAHLTARVHGWEGPILDDQLMNQNVALDAVLDGTVRDVAGNTYRVIGRFGQDGTTRFPLSIVPFDGVGHLLIVGPGGMVSGDAAFRDVQDFPLEWDFWFTSITACRLR